MTREDTILRTSRKGIEIEVIENEVSGLKWNIDTTEHDKQIRVEVLTEFAKRLLDYDTPLTNEDIVDELCFFVDRDEVDKRLKENK